MADLPDNTIPHFHQQTMTPEEAAQTLLCPVARVMTKPGDGGRCIGASCAAWRFLPIMVSDATFKGAVQREIGCIRKEYEDRKAKGEKGPVPSDNLLHQQAVARVAADPSAYCIPAHHERGYCGLGGKP